MARTSSEGRYVARIDEGYFSEHIDGQAPSRAAIELAVDRMNHWLAVNCSAGVRIKVELVERFEDRQIYKVTGLAKLERLGVFDMGYADVNGAVQFAWEYALETWPVDGHVEVRP